MSEIRFKLILRDHKKTLPLVIMAILLLIVAYVLWSNYLDSHFIGTFDQYGLPVQFSQTGWSLLFIAWPLWAIPLMVIQALIYIGRLVFSCWKHTPISPEPEKPPISTPPLHHLNENDFSRALEIETLKFQFDTIKKKYFEEHKKMEETLLMAKKAKGKKSTNSSKSPEIMSTNANHSSAHYEAIITSLKAENKKSLKQIAVLKEDLEQSHSLIEKLLIESP